MSALRIWRKTSGKTQEQLAVQLGENPKTYSAYERGASPIPPEILEKLRSLGYKGPSDQHPLATPGLTREDLDRAFAELRGYFENRFSEFSDGLSHREVNAKAVDKGSREFGPEDSRRQKDKGKGRETILLPEHVQDAWVILSRAVDKAGADYRFMDRKALGLLVGLTAQEIAEKGFSESTQTRLLARAEGFVHAALGRPEQ